MEKQKTHQTSGGIGSRLATGVFSIVFVSLIGNASTQTEQTTTEETVFSFAEIVNSVLASETPESLNQIVLHYRDDAVVSRGQRLYMGHCAACHGINLQGAPNWHRRNSAGYLPAPPHDETGHTWHHRDQLLFDLTKYGPQVVAGSDYKTHMPAYEGMLSDEEIVAVLSFIKSTWPEEIIRIHNEQINQN